MRRLRAHLPARLRARLHARVRAGVRARWVVPPVVALTLSLIGATSTAPGFTGHTKHAGPRGNPFGGYASRAARIDALLCRHSIALSIPPPPGC